jgi:hypothetical protein
VQEGLQPTDFCESWLKFWFQGDHRLFEREGIDCQAAFFERIWGSIVNTQFCAVQPNMQSSPDTLTWLRQPGVPFQIGEQNVAILFLR